MAFTPVLSVTIDEGQLREATHLLRDVKNGVPTVLVSGINRTLPQLKTFVSREIRDRVRIPKRLIDQRLTIKKASTAQLSGTLKIEHSRRLSLGDFAPRQLKSGVSYALAKGGRKTIPGAFLVTLPSRNGPYQQVFRRAPGWKHRQPKTYRGHRRKGLSGLPVISLKGVSAWGVFTKAGLQRPTEIEAARLLGKNIENRLDRLLFTKTGAGLATIRGGEA